MRRHNTAGEGVHSLHPTCVAGRYTIACGWRFILLSTTGDALQQAARGPFNKKGFFKVEKISVIKLHTNPNVEHTSSTIKHAYNRYSKETESTLLSLKCLLIRTYFLQRVRCGFLGQCTLCAGEISGM